MTKSALLVIDMQNGFLDPQGSLPTLGLTVPNADSIIRAIIDLTDRARANRIPVLYTRHVFRAGQFDVAARTKRALPAGVEILVRGTWDAEIVDSLRPHAGDVVIDKNRYDAFLYTDLEVVLRSLDVTRLLLTGVLTNVCVESTARSAEQRDFVVFVASDCTSAEPAAHEAALESMSRVCASVGAGSDLLDAIAGEPRIASAFQTQGA